MIHVCRGQTCHSLQEYSFRHIPQCISNGRYSTMNNVEDMRKVVEVLAVNSALMLSILESFPDRIPLGILFNHSIPNSKDRPKLTVIQGGKDRSETGNGV